MVKPMNQRYKLTDTTDLTFDDVIIPEHEKQSSNPVNLHPTVAQQAKFIQNCVDMGILLPI